eukprot:TRINITY_DN2743_c0_g1_i4.p1 TRINITY_DN2743_c0_g1~~TRINITY_DN2743_c0_g1_i4.p1  ORF type:complete len:120 (+),score=6.38 TRINITY_DN2743_c0_g1_i4:205-564(+)
MYETQSNRNPRGLQQLINNSHHTRPHQTTPHQTTPQQITFNDLVPLGDTPEELVRRERDVQEESYLQIYFSFPQHGWEEHQVVVVDPDQVAWADDLEDGIAEEAVYFEVLAVPVFVEVC